MIIKYLILGITVVYVVTVIIIYVKPEKTPWRSIVFAIHTITLGFDNTYIVKDQGTKVFSRLRTYKIR